MMENTPASMLQSYKALAREHASATAARSARFNRRSVVDDDFAFLKAKLQRRGALELEAWRFDDFMVGMHLQSVQSLQSCLAEMKACELSAFADDIIAGAKKNPMFVQYVRLCVDKAQEEETTAAVASGREQTSEAAAEADSNEQLKHAVHYCVFLNALTQAITEAEGGDLLTEVMDALWQGFASQKGGFLFGVLPHSHSAFELAKFYSVNVVISDFKKHSNFKKDQTKQFSAFWKSAIVRLNILEAVLADASRGNTKNATAGLSMVLRNGSVCWDSSNSTDALAKQLYESWNMAFVCSEYKQYNNVPFFQAKLLIPTLLNADISEYYFVRTVSLMIHAFANGYDRINRSTTGGPKPIFRETANSTNSFEVDTSVLSSLNESGAQTWVNRKAR